MPKLTVTEYLMGREKKYATSLSVQILKNAEVLVGKLNRLLARADDAGVTFEINPVTKTILNSGWRPPAVNATTKGAAVNSKHMTGEAVDVYDPDGDLDEWLLSEDGQEALEDIGLWMEHPAATKGWSHLQTKPPRSGRRIFYP